MLSLSLSLTLVHVLVVVSMRQGYFAVIGRQVQMKTTRIQGRNVTMKEVGLFLGFLGSSIGNPFGVVNREPAIQ